MSWLFSQALVAEYSQANCLEIESSAPLNVMPTPHKFSRNGKMMECSDLSRFGLTCVLLTEGRGMDLLTWFQEGFRARTLAPQERGRGLMANDLGCGRTWSGLLARYDHYQSAWRTAQCSFLEDSAEFSETWPRSGMTRNGSAYLRPTAARHISATASGLWPTPAVCGNYNRKGASKTSGDGLATAVRMYPTPTSSEHKYRINGDSQQSKSLGAMARREAIGQSMPDGQLDPNWVEWLMGWPIGWTDLKPLGMARFPQWRQQHSESFPSNEGEA